MRHQHHFMYTDPQIIFDKKTGDRAYVKTYIDGKRYRFYNGHLLGIKLNPNLTKTLKEKERALNQLAFELRKQLEKGWRPTPKSESKKLKVIEPEAVILSASEAILSIVHKLEEEPISALHRRDMERLGGQLILFLSEKNLHQIPVNQISIEVLLEFLEPYKTSGTNFNSRRRTLSAILVRMVKEGYIPTNPLSGVKKQKEYAHLHLPFKKDQLKVVLNRIREEHPHLYFCCLLMYGCLLRPHQEIRLLTRGDFDETFSRITLKATANKGRKIRTVHIPDYIKTELIERGVDKLSDGFNIFTETTDVYNECYFNTAWSRIKERLLKEGIVKNDHTLYSFRHTAAVNIYLKTRDIYVVQQALGHSSLTVTLTYLRNLGMMLSASADQLPDL